MPDNIYQKQAELLLRILPLVMREDVFALKGGTAINFFWRDYPRLSLDIDLTYLPVKDRDQSLLDISDRLASNLSFFFQIEGPHELEAEFLYTRYFIKIARFFHESDLYSG